MSYPKLVCYKEEIKCAIGIRFKIKMEIESVK